MQRHEKGCCLQCLLISSDPQCENPDEVICVSRACGVLRECRVRSERGVCGQKGAIKFESSGRALRPINQRAPATSFCDSRSRKLLDKNVIRRSTGRLRPAKEETTDGRFMKVHAAFFFLPPRHRNFCVFWRGHRRGSARSASSLTLEKKLKFYLVVVARHKNATRTTSIQLCPSCDT